MRGSHGTCKSFAQSIEKEGFQSGSQGQLGKGIYFWMYSDSDKGQRLGLELAEIWFRWSLLKTQRYHHAEDLNCAVVLVTMEFDQDSSLDFDDVEIDADFAEFYETVRHRFADLSREDVSSIRDEFIAVMEEVRDAKYDAILGMVDFPHDSLPIGHYKKINRRSRCASVQNKRIAQICKIEYTEED